jgi:hypothetical protein
MHRHFRRLKSCVGSLPDFRGVCLVDQEVDPEIPAQFEVRPMVERVADQLGHRARERDELLIVTA